MSLGFLVPTGEDVDFWASAGRAGVVWGVARIRRSSGPAMRWHAAIVKAVGEPLVGIAGRKGVSGRSATGISAAAMQEPVATSHGPAAVLPRPQVNILAGFAAAADADDAQHARMQSRTTRLGRIWHPTSVAVEPLRLPNTDRGSVRTPLCRCGDKPPVLPCAVRTQWLARIVRSLHRHAAIRSGMRGLGAPFNPASAAGQRPNPGLVAIVACGPFAWRSRPPVDALALREFAAQYGMGKVRL